uniref:Uncharacterized protein n=1 Tax=Populus trichocarpa TaxID=3694 RepID=A0A2K1WQZ5_POPTR
MFISSLIPAGSDWVFKAGWFGFFSAFRRVGRMYFLNKHVRITDWRWQASMYGSRSSHTEPLVERFS